MGSVSGTESPQSCLPEPTDPPQGEPQRAEAVLEEQLVDLASSEPVVLYQSPLSSGTQPTTSKEAFSKENVSSVASVTVRANNLMSNLPNNVVIVMVNWGVMLL